MERFDLYAAKNGVVPAEEAATSNGHMDDKTAAAASSPSQEPPARIQSPSKHQRYDAEPPAKKHKPDTDVDADALYAAKLQAEENMRARPTRGGNSRRTAPSKKKSKAKTSKRVRPEDDSDVESGSDTKKEVNRSGGFHVRTALAFALKLSDRSSETAQPLSSALGASRRRGDGKSSTIHMPTQALIPQNSFRGRKQLKRSGSIYVIMTSRTPVTDAKSAVTML